MRREKRRAELEERYRADQQRKRARRKHKNSPSGGLPATMAMARQPESTEEGMKHRLPGSK